MIAACTFKTAIHGGLVVLRAAQEEQRFVRRRRGKIGARAAIRRRQFRFITCPPRGDTTLAARLSQISLKGATAAEDCLQAACHSYRWQLPRRQRLQHRYSLPDVPWRGVFIARVCRGCHAAAGDFAVKDTGAGAPKCFLCGKCAKEPSVVERLQRSNLTLDVTGLSGKPLFTRRESKFCSDVSRLSKEAIDNANGAKADRIARGRR